MAKREEQIQLAKFAEQTERYNDMVVFIKNVVKLNNELTNEERNLLSVAYKNVTSTCRSAWRIMSNIEMESECSENKRQMATQYREKIENELKSICQDMLMLLDEYLIKMATTIESKIFFLKMKGDYYRYLAEITNGNERQKIAEESHNAYAEAFTIAKNEISVTNPIRLGLVLNFSVFYYEIQSQPDTACRLAKEALDEALAEIDSMDEFVYRDSIVIMQLLRDNLTLWANEVSDVDNKNQSEEQE